MYPAGFTSTQHAVQHVPRKRFGQNFLEDDAIVGRIVDSIAPRPGQRVVEIGPGLGALTRELLQRVDSLDVVELDRDLAASLAGRLGHPPGLRIHQTDALTFDFSALAGAEPLRVVGNLPYNISTPLLFHLLAQADAIVDSIADMHFMLQKEVVDRITAKPGGRDWGRLSVMCAARAEAQSLFTVPPEAFRPMPKVDSAVVRIVPRTLADAERAALPALEQVVRAAFAQRRKTLRNNLKGLIEASAIERLGIDPSRRAETLTLAEFRTLTRALAESEA